MPPNAGPRDAALRAREPSRSRDEKVTHTTCTAISTRSHQRVSHSTIDRRLAQFRLRSAMRSQTATGLLWLLVVGCGCWLLVVGCWLLVVGCWLLVVGCWLLVVGVVVVCVCVWCVLVCVCVVAVAVAVAVAWWCVVWCGVVWCGVEWSGVEWSGVEWSGVEWSGAEWSGVVWSGVVLVVVLVQTVEKARRVYPASHLRGCQTLQESDSRAAGGWRPCICVQGPKKSTPPHWDGESLHELQADATVLPNTPLRLGILQDSQPLFRWRSLLSS